MLVYALSSSPLTPSTRSSSLFSREEGSRAIPSRSRSCKKSGTERGDHASWLLYLHGHIYIHYGRMIRDVADTEEKEWGGTTLP